MEAKEKNDESLMVTDTLTGWKDIRLAKEKVSDDQLPEKIGETVRKLRPAIQEAVESFLNSTLEALVLFEALVSAECHSPRKASESWMKFNIGGLLDDIRAFSNADGNPDTLDRRRSIAKRFLS